MALQSQQDLFSYAIQAALLTLFLANVVAVIRGASRTFLVGTQTWHGWFIRVGSPAAWLSVLVTLIVAPTMRPLEQAIAGLAFVFSWFMFRAATRATEKNRFTRAFSTDIPNQLVRTGVYQWVRHPFYCSYLLIVWGGVFATSAKLWVLVPAVALTCVYRYAIYLEEKKFSRSPLAESYAQYRAEVGMLVPRARSLFSAQKARA